MTTAAAQRVMATANRHVLVTLAAPRFLMALNMSAMNVSIATTAGDVLTTITGIQTAVTLPTPVKATLMITGAKIGAMDKRRKAFIIAGVIYACGSLTTTAAPNLAVVILGRSRLEGIGAALIKPVVVARVADNFAPADRSRADGHSADTDQDPTDRRISPDHGAELDFRRWHTAHTTRPDVRSMS